MRSSLVLAFFALVASVPACGSSDEAPATTTSATPDPKRETVVIGPGGVRAPVATPEGQACLALEGGGDCVRPQDQCPAGRADVVIDAKGKVAAVICYPAGGAPAATVAEGGAATVSAGNNEVVVIDGKDDGVDVTGDVVVEGNNAVVYGSGPATSVIGGDLIVAKNNGAIRGVRIEGDVQIDGNNTALLDCVVKGSLRITSNNNVIVGCTVFGNVEITGNNTALFYNRLGGTLSGEAKGLVCEDNRSFSDADVNGLVADGELGAAVSCGK